MAQTLGLRPTLTTTFFDVVVGVGDALPNHDISECRGHVVGDCFTSDGPTTAGGVVVMSW